MAPLSKLRARGSDAKADDVPKDGADLTDQCPDGMCSSSDGSGKARWEVVKI